MQSEPSRSDSGNWALRADDLLPERLRKREEFRDITDNVVFRLLIHERHRTGVKRGGMMGGYLLGCFALGVWYCHIFFRLGALDSMLASTGLTIVMGLVIGILYVQAGIEGYESNGALKPYFLDLIVAGVPAEEIARGIWAKTVTHYRVGLIRFSLVVVCLAAYFIILRLNAVFVPFLLNWVLMLGVAGAAHLIRLMEYLDSVTLPGTLLWYSGVRRGYQRKLDELQGDEPSFLRFLFRFFFFDAVSFGFFVLPFTIYLAVGLIVGRFLRGSSNNQSIGVTDLTVVSLIMMAVGLGTGWIFGAWCRERSRSIFARLVREIATLFEIRGEVLSTR